MKPPISNEARGRLRELTAALETSAALITTALDRVPRKVLNPVHWKGAVGRERAIEKIISALPAAPELRVAGRAVWRFLQPTDTLPHLDGEKETAGFIMMSIIAGAKNRMVRCETFGCAFSNHSICRLLDRSNFRADPEEAMFTAHSALTWVNEEDGARLFDLKNAQMPAAGGVFLATPGRFGPTCSPLLIGRTWIGKDQLYRDQANDLQAWETLLELSLPRQPA